MPRTLFIVQRSNSIPKVVPYS